jgi:ribonuclease P/MRP protein subunit RPP1
MDVDIISLDLSQRLPYYLKHATLGSATSRGVFIEISYAPSLTDLSSRRQLLSNANAIVRASRGRGLLITSSATQAMGLRSPYDVINLATFWGLSQERGREAMAENARKVLVKAQTRTGVHKGVLRMLTMPQETPSATNPQAGEAIRDGASKGISKKEKKGAKREAGAALGAAHAKKRKETD